MAVAFGIIQECEPLELIRLNIDGAAQWAIVGKPDNAYRPLGVFLYEETRYRSLNVSDGMLGILNSFDHPIVRYGMDYEIVHDHAGPCCINEGEYFISPGVIVSSDSGTFLIFSSKEAKRTAYLNLQTGKFGAEVGGARVAFADWALIHNSLGEEPIILKRESKRTQPAP